MARGSSKNLIMLRSRTIKTLTALLVTMTMGSLALVVMETAPIRPEITHLAAVEPAVNEPAEVISSTQVPLQRTTWQNIVIHSSVEGDQLAAQCHFVVWADEGADGLYAQATPLWKQQQRGRHLAGRLADNSIGVFIVGRFDTQGPSARQFEALVNLSRNLQKTCAIPADRVYLARELDPRCASPGKAFPMYRFNGLLLQRGS